MQGVEPGEEKHMKKILLGSLLMLGLTAGGARATEVLQLGLQEAGVNSGNISWLTPASGSSANLGIVNGAYGA